MGSPPMAVPPLRALLDAGHEVVLVVSNPDRRRGRRRAPEPTAVKAAALEAGIPVTADPDDILSIDADLGVVVAYGRIIRPHVLAHLPMVNLHFSLLPRWRGAAPVERAILAGDETTGVCVMDVAEELDTGAVHARAEVDIRPGETAAELRDRLVSTGTELLVETLSAPLGVGEPQSPDGVTYADKIATDDLRLDWERPARELGRVVRVGGAWTTWRGARLKVHGAEPVEVDGPGPGAVDGDLVGCGEGSLRLQEVQPEGRSAMGAGDWLRGARPAPGERLGS